MTSRRSRPNFRRANAWVSTAWSPRRSATTRFWWWAWAHGLAAYGRPLEPVYATMVLWAIIGGYVAQRVIEGVFLRRFGGMHIHV